jgi:glycosyltransferase involved in cell wall biosynthesis
MDILLISPVFYPEPLAMSTIVEDLANYLGEQNHSVTVLTSYPCRPYGHQLPPTHNKANWKFKRVILSSYVNPKSEFIPRFRENISFGTAICQYIDAHHHVIDVIYMTTFPLFAPKAILKTALKYNIPVVNHIEDIYPEPFKQKIPFLGNLVYRCLLPMDKWIVKNTTVSIVIGKKIKDFFIRTRNVLPDKIQVVYNWQDESRYQYVSTQKEDNEPFTFMYVGSISKAANLFLVLNAFIEANIENSRLVFAGSGNELESLKASSAGDARISFIEARAENVGEIQSKADVLILPLLPTVALRAVPSKTAAYLFSHKPVLACVESDSDVAEIINEGDCGWIASPSDIHSVSSQMKLAAMKTKEQLSTMGEKGYKYSQLHLTKEVNLKKLADIITSCKGI